MTAIDIETRTRAYGERASIPAHGTELVALEAVPLAAWQALSDRAIEPNAFFQPAWARAVCRHAEGKGSAQALLAWDGPARRKLIGLLPVLPAAKALRLPIPALVAWQAYAPLTTPLLDRDDPETAAEGLVLAAKAAGAQALMLPKLATEGPAAQALRRASQGATRSIHPHQRARLDATQDFETLMRDALGAKKLKELRRQRNRLADDGEVSFSIVADARDVAPALDDFLALEAAGWKGQRGTALGQKQGDARFVREAMTALISEGTAGIALLRSGARTVAAGLVLRHRERAFFFKIAYDETLAKSSPGVQITLDLTRALCGDPAIRDADSIAVAGHPMIDHVWRDSLAVADMVLPTGGSPTAFRLCAALIEARHAARETARSLLHRFRS